MTAVARFVFVLALITATVAGDQPTAANRATPGEAVVHASGRTATSIAVSWMSDATPNRWWVVVSSASDDRSAGQRTVAGTRREVVVEHLAPDSTYLVRVVPVDPGSGFGAFSSPVEVRTPPMDACSGAPSSVTCAVADVTAPVGPATGVGNGFLHSISDGTDPARVRVLHPTAWRLSALDFERFAVARRYGGPITALVSDPWAISFGSKPPWDRWEFYKMWVGWVVDLHVRAGMLPDFWEIQNEPSSPQSYIGGTPPTPELVSQQYAVAAEVIHQKLPDAKVIGPASAYVTFGSGLTDIDGFLDRAAAAGLRLAGVSWHEIGAGCLGTCDGSPRAVLQHADDVRAAIAAHPALGPLSLHVDEYTAPWNARQPGAVAGYLSSLAYAGVDEAMQTCNPVDLTSGGNDITCWRKPGMLDGLLLDDGATATDAWYVHRAYADMTAPGATLVASAIADPEASVVATVDTGGVIRVLAGRHTGCQTGVDDNCPEGFSYATPRDVAVVIDVGPRSPASYTVTVQRIVSVHGASAGPETIATSRVAVRDGRVDAGTFRTGDGDALVVVLTPS